MTRRRAGVSRAGLLVTALATVAVACGGGDAEPQPIVDRIDDAIAAVEDHYGAPPEFVEISATESLVNLIVATDGGPEQSFWDPADGLVEPIPIDAPERPVFSAGAIAFDPDAVFDRLRDELPDAEIVDFAITGTDGGGVVYDARLRSSQGGVLLVLLGPDGRILGVQAE